MTGQERHPPEARLAEELRASREEVERGRERAEAALEQERRQREMAETLQQLALELNAELDEERILERTLELASRVVPGDSGLVWMLEGEEVRVAATQGPREARRLGDRYPLAAIALVRHVIVTRQTLRLDHLQADPRFVGITPYETPLSYVAAPLLVAGGPIGSISIRQTGIGAYTEEHERALEAFANQAALALHNARLIDEAERHAREEETVARAAAAIASGGSLDAACHDLLLALRPLLPFDRASVALLEPGGETARLVGVYGLERTSLPAGSLIPLADSVLATALASRRPHLLTDLAQETGDRRLQALAAEGYRSALVVPLVIPHAEEAPAGQERQPLGTLNVVSRQPGRYGPAEAALLERVAGRLAGALEAAHVREERDQAAARVALLQRLTAVVNRSLDLRQVFSDFSHELRRSVAFDRMTVYVVEPAPGALRRYAIFGEGAEEVPEGTSLDPAASAHAAVLASGRPQVRPDIERDQRFPYDANLLARGIRSGAVLPLIAGGRTIGAVSLASRTPGAFSTFDLDLLQPVADQLALAVDRSLAHERVVEQAARLEAVNRVARLVAEGLDLRRTFGAFTAALQPLVPHDRAALDILRPGAAELERMVEAAPGAEELAADSPPSLPLEGSAAGWVLQRRQPLLRYDIAAEPASDGFATDVQTLAEGIRSSVLLPLVVGYQALGVLILASRQPAAFQEAHLLLLAPLADQLALALQNALLHETVRQQAITDPLTGLFNRRYFDDHLEPELQRCRRLGYSLGLLFADLDELKETNDVLGHLAGDAALRLAATTLQASLRATDLLTRWGGDEFVMLLPGQTHAGLRSVGEKLGASLTSQPPFVPGATGRPLTLSLGGAMYPDDADSAQGLLEAADRALLAAKAQGGDRCFLAPDLAPSTPTPADTSPIPFPGGGRPESS